MKRENKKDDILINLCSFSYNSFIFFPSYAKKSLVVQGWLGWGTLQSRGGVFFHSAMNSKPGFTTVFGNLPRKG